MEGNKVSMSSGSDSNRILLNAKQPLISEAKDEQQYNYSSGANPNQSNSAIKSTQLLSYIQTLLERQPGKPVDTTLVSSTSGGGGSGCPETSEEFAAEHWAQVIQNNPTIFKDLPTDNMKQTQFINLSKKPPWKPT